MKDLSGVCFIIQARLSSRRVPRKMIRPFAGTTLVDIALRKVSQSRFISRDNFYFAVYEQELVKIGEKHGVQIFRRSAKSASAENSLQQIYEWHNRLGYTYVIKINACAPLLTVETIDDFIDNYLNSVHDGLFGVVERRDYYWSSKGVLQTPWPKGVTIMNTKAVEPTYQAAHCLYASRMDAIKKGFWMGRFQTQNDPALYRMDELETFDIDYNWQFEMCEAYYARKYLKT